MTTEEVTRCAITRIKTLQEKGPGWWAVCLPGPTIDAVVSMFVPTPRELVRALRESRARHGFVLAVGGCNDDTPIENIENICVAKTIRREIVKRLTTTKTQA